jgi:hypothetical protein
MLKIALSLTAFGLLAGGSATAALEAHDTAIQSATAQANPVKAEVDWPAFIARHDLVWDAMPKGFDNGAFLGNGLLGTTIYQEGDNRLRFEMGRADVTDHRRDNNRLPIGGLVLTTVGKIQSGNMRLDLWNAEVRGYLTTDKGTIAFRAVIHTAQMVLLADLETTGNEKTAALAWNPAKCVDPVRNIARLRSTLPYITQDPPNPPHELSVVDGIQVCSQKRIAGGEFATAWTQQNTASGKRIFLSIIDTFPGNAAVAESVKTVKTAMTADYQQLRKSHSDWWHAFYPQTLVSIPDAKLESFYWIQWYKMACASRPGPLPTDLLGPWYRQTGWPRVWWDLNIEIFYLPVYAGNRLALGESFVQFMDTKRDSFYRNAKERFGFDDCAYVTVTTDNQGLRGDGCRAPDTPGNPYFTAPGNLTWALHDYYLHYRYTMNHELVTDHKKHAFYPLLRDNIRLFMRLLVKGEDGKLHLPPLNSPEYLGSSNDTDTTYNLAMLRWGCQTLIELNQRYNLNDPQLPEWRSTLKNLVDYPVDQNGFRIGAKLGFDHSHRHWSHLFMVYPLHIMNGDTPEERDLINRSIKRFLTVQGGKELFGWSRAGVSSIYSMLGDGTNAAKQLHLHMNDRRFVRPNTMYIEGDPVLECSTFVNNAVQDMLIQSWGNTIRVFPAIPAAWKEIVFHDLRAEGAFLVSAVRQDGKTSWVRIKSLAGEPCRIQPNFATEPKLLVNGKPVTLKPAVNGIYELPVEKGDEALLFTGAAPVPVVKPLPVAPEACNPFGLRNQGNK